MASSSGVQLQQQQYETSYQCKECGMKYNSSESLNIHLQYTHKDNLLSKWAAQAASSHPSEETNNNKPSMKREFLSNTIAAAADSSDATAMNKKSPDYGSRTTPETSVNFGHPPTPQSYQSASSPYQNNTTPNDFSPGFQNYQTIKQERISPHYHQNYNPYPVENQFFALNPQQENYVDYVPKVPNSSFRYHPYQQQTPYNNPQVSSSSPAYPPQPTPSPSPKQCDKCGYFCETATQLIEHLNNAHPPTPAYQPANNFLFPKTEEEQQSDILDLDSHKVHQVYPEDEKRLPNWHQQQQQRLYTNGREVFPQEQKLFSSHQDYMSGGSVTTTQAEVVQNYRPFELPPQPAMPVTSSTQPANPAAPPTTTKSANWKSNEARRPKTYNCTACNKWFTSSGHLKRHYNTTLHKNAVKSSGQPDPATLPISAHHHPARDSASNREEVSPNEDSRGDDNSMPPVMYDRQPLPNLPSPPNGEAGPSATTIDSRGLLPFPHHPGFTPSMETNHQQHHHQFQMYPNVSAPHVTQLTATNSHNTTGEYEHQYLDAMTITEPQPLPSFEQIQRYSGGAALSLLGTANVGGAGPVTAPYSLYNNGQQEEPEPTALIVRQGPDDYRLLLNIVRQATDAEVEDILQYSPTTDNNNHKTELPPPPSPEKAKTKTDYEDSSPQITSTVPPTKQPNIHKCFDCDKIFNKACYLTQHNKTFHSGDKPFKCQRCGKRFSIDKIYEEHIKKHAGDKPYKCNQCPKQFNHKTDLRRHMCLHTGQKPFACDTCGKGFIRKDHMLKHCETHTRKPHATKGAAVVR